MVALEDPAGEAEAFGEAVKLVVGLVAHEVSPAAPPPRPSRLVDEDQGRPTTGGGASLGRGGGRVNLA